MIFSTRQILPEPGDKPAVSPGLPWFRQAITEPRETGTRPGYLPPPSTGRTDDGSPHAPASTTGPPEALLVERSTIVVMTEDDMDQTDPPSPKVVAALLRDARSVSRRADKLGADVAAMQDPTIQELATQASSSIDQLVHQLMRLDQQAQRTRRATGHRAP